MFPLIEPCITPLPTLPTSPPTPSPTTPTPSTTASEEDTSATTPGTPPSASLGIHAISRSYQAVRQFGREIIFGFAALVISFFTKLFVILIEILSLFFWHGQKWKVKIMVGQEKPTEVATGCCRCYFLVNSRLKRCHFCQHRN